MIMDMDKNMEEDPKKQKKDEISEGPENAGKGNGPGTAGDNEESKTPSQSRRVTSTVRKMHWYLMGKKFWQSLRSSLVLFFGMSGGFIFGAEFISVGEVLLPSAAKRTISAAGETKEIFYQLIDRSEGTVLFEVSILRPLLIAGIIAAVVLVIRLLVFLAVYFREDQEIRGILNPINEIALKADELGRLSFTEDKYQLIEDAITRIQPQDAQNLALNDSDLSGIEAAMNNLVRRVRETYQQQARFVNDASHELRTPIAVIQGYASMLIRWGKKDEKILDESIQAIKHESDHMYHLVEQLLFLARGDSDRIAMNPETVQVNELMRELYEESLMIDENHIYRLKEKEDILLVDADYALLKQALRILVDNAAKYTPEKEEILLQYGLTEDDEVFLQVEDRGIGMREKDVEHMFERFYRSDEARNYQGTGLGLSIAKWIVDRHRGHFEILSRLGLGTRIRIILQKKKELPA